MKLEFENIVFKNLFSYGDIENQLIFNEGINLITNNDMYRSNGIGKSSSLLSIPLSLFGKTPKKTIQSDIINWQNSKDCYVKINFKKNLIPVSIERYFRPNNLDFFINNDLQPKDSSVTITQTKIEELLKCDFRIFNNIIYCTGNDTSLIDAPALEKRKFLENFFDIEFISQLNEQITKKITNINNQKSTLVQNLKIYEDELEAINKKLLEYDKDINIEETKENYDTLKLKYDEYLKTHSLIDDDKILSYEKVIEKLKVLYNKLEKEATELVNQTLQLSNKKSLLIQEIKKCNIKYCGDELLSFHKNNISNYDQYTIEGLNIPNEVLETLNLFLSNETINLKQYDFILKQLNNELSKIIENVGDVIECPTCGKDTNKDEISEYQNKKKIEITRELKIQDSERVKTEHVISTLKSDIEKKKNEIKEYQKNLDAKSDLEIRIRDNEVLKNTIDEHEKEIKEIDIKNDGLTTQIKQIKYLEVDKKIKYLDTKISDNDRIKNKLISMEIELDLTKKLWYSCVKEIENKDKIVNDIKNDIEKKKEKINEISKNLKGINTTFDYLSYIKDSCQDKKIKQWIINDNMPYINERANHYLSILGINYYLEISGFLDIKIHGLGVSDVNIKSLSSGEQRSVDLAIKFALMDTSQIKNDLYVDILILDEIFDSAIDEEGISQLIKIIRQRQSEQNLKVFITSHRKEIKDFDVDHLYEISKPNNFSEIRMIY